MVVQIIEKPVVKSTTRNYTDILKKKGTLWKFCDITKLKTLEFTCLSRASLTVTILRIDFDKDIERILGFVPWSRKISKAVRIQIEGALDETVNGHLCTLLFISFHLVS